MRIFNERVMTVRGQEIRVPEPIVRLPKDKRGYPILFTLVRQTPRIVNKAQPGVPEFMQQIKTETTEAAKVVYDFSTISDLRVRHCLRKGLCGICGVELVEPGTAQNHHYRSAFIGGPVSTSATFVFNDPGMHTQCADFAMKVCPWIVMRNYRRDEIETGFHPAALINRPPYFGKLLTSNYAYMADEGHILIVGHGHVKLEKVYYPEGPISDDEEKAIDEMVRNHLNPGRERLKVGEYVFVPDPSKPVKETGIITAEVQNDEK